jgi:hypothetical protein
MREQKVGGYLFPLWKRGNKGDLIVWREVSFGSGCPTGQGEQCEAKNLPSPLFFKEG